MVPEGTAVDVPWSNDGDGALYKLLPGPPLPVLPTLALELPPPPPPLVDTTVFTKPEGSTVEVPGTADAAVKEVPVELAVVPVVYIGCWVYNPVGPVPLAAPPVPYAGSTDVPLNVAPVVVVVVVVDVVVPVDTGVIVVT